METERSGRPLQPDRATSLVPFRFVWNDKQVDLGGPLWVFGTQACESDPRRHVARRDHRQAWLTINPLGLCARATRLELVIVTPGCACWIVSSTLLTLTETMTGIGR